MKTLTSRSNPRYRQWLAEMKHAGRTGHAAWLEGIHLCQAWLDHRGQPQWALFAQDASEHAEVRHLAEQVEPDKQVWMPAKLLASLSTLVTAPMVIFIAQPVMPQRDGAPGLDQLGTSLMLDDLQDPGNVGTLLRTAAAAGVAQVFTGPGTAACWSPKVLRAGQGAHFTLRIEESVDLASLLSMQSKQVKRTPVLATTLDASAKSLYELDLREDVIWVFGQEGRGVAPELVDLADHKVYIPHDNQAVESLNVASAAAICLFEQRRQRLARRRD